MRAFSGLDAYRTALEPVHFSENRFLISISFAPGQYLVGIFWLNADKDFVV